MGCDFLLFRQKLKIRRTRFQSTHPVWGATVCDFFIGPIQGISIHAPRVGCDHGPAAKESNTVISIHAPRVGCDTGHILRGFLLLQFQSTHPVWGATLTFVFPPFSVKQFQSTHPVWGATQTPPPDSRCLADFNPRTPCGGRLPGQMLFSPPDQFQSTHPVWGATGIPGVQFDQCGRFQSTHPVWGATLSM